MDLKAGDRLIVIKTFRTLASVVYEVGDVLELIEPTGQDPWNNNGAFIAPHAWVVKCKHWSPPSPESIWGSIYHCIEVGYLKKMENN